MTVHKLVSESGPGEVLRVTPELAGWDVLDFSVMVLEAGQTWSTETGGREVAVVPLEGSFTATVGTQEFVLRRSGVFTEMPSVLYLPPDTTLEVVATSATEFAIGGAAADGRYPVRLIEPHEMKAEVRGGGGATRQVNHILAHPLPAERLILYEVYVPRGGWSGWPPHCHDGYEDSPYLEETYYFRFDPPDGWGLHRNYRRRQRLRRGLLRRQDRDVVMVTQGFHSSAAAPGSHMYFLNYLAGTPHDDERAIPPFFQPEYRWIDGNWDVDAMTLPTVGPEGAIE